MDLNAGMKNFSKLLTTLLVTFSLSACDGLGDDDESTDTSGVNVNAMDLSCRSKSKN